MDRAALLVGIDEYAGAPLRGCVADATALTELLARDADGTPNFACTTMASAKAPVTRASLRAAVRRLFSNRNIDLALFYFAGHGIRSNDLGGYLVTQDFDSNDEGVGMADILTLANNSPARERIIILDCCYAGALDDAMLGGGAVSLARGGTLLLGCGGDETSTERGGRGVFTRYVCDALEGGAADVQGFVTLGDIYNYLNQVLSLTEQRPVLHANLANLRPLRRARAAIADARLRDLTRLFDTEDALLPLSPAYATDLGATDDALISDFRCLQSMRAARLVEPVDTEHMYFAAKKSLPCRLTALGRSYWRKAARGAI
jgi:uncharacterized caspase-like protein